LGEKVKKPVAKQMLLTREQYMKVNKNTNIDLLLILSTMLMYLMAYRCLHGGAPTKDRAGK
jgi:hypothetical protein